MNRKNRSRITEILRKHYQDVLDDWIKEQLAAATIRPDLMSESELRKQSADFLSAFRKATQGGNLTDIATEEWADVRELLGSISHSRAEQGFTPSETATFIFSLKRPLFGLLQRGVKDGEALASEMWTTTTLLDKLGLYTIDLYREVREELIKRQQLEIHELSTPVVQLWKGILGVPLIGTLDSSRTQVVMESLLTKIAETGSDIAIIDITGVPAVDTQVAQHLFKTVAAARLMGADCIVSGIRPQIAQTIIGLGVKFDFITKASLADALEAAFQKAGIAVKKNETHS